MKRTTGCVLAGLLAMSPGAAAFGLKTHLWIGQQIVDDVRDDCVVVIAGSSQHLPTDVCTSIRNHPDEFRAGTLGPDIYPDFVTGQVNMHPGLGHDPRTIGKCTPNTGWNTSDWLRHVYRDARPGRELAFAAGYLVHAASDVFAHTLVNAYAGKPFDLLDGENHVEYRHAIIERYVDNEISLDEEALQFAIPKAFVLDRLVLGACAGQEAQRKLATSHIRRMSERYARMLDLAGDFASAGQEGSDERQKAIVAANRIEADLALAQAQLPAAQSAAVQAGMEVAAREADRQAVQAAYSEKRASITSAIAADSAEAQALDALREQFEEFRQLQLESNDANAEVARLETLVLKAPAERAKALKRADEAERVSRKSLEAREKAREWVRLMDESGRKYLDLAHQAAVRQVHGDLAAEQDEASYSDWLKCDALAFAPVSHLAKDWACAVRDLEKSIANALEDVPWWSKLTRAKQKFDDFVREETKKLVFEQIRKRDDPLPRLAALLAEPGLASREELQRAYASAGGGLVTLEDAAMLVEADFGLGSDPWDPAKAPAIAHAISLSKLSLLDRRGLETLAGDLGAEPSLVRTVDGEGRYSVLYQTVRSIDGNHQWQRHGLPYWRQGGTVFPKASRCRRFGYDASDGENMGFPFFVDATLREKVFPKIFDAPVYGALAAHMKGFAQDREAGTSTKPFPFADDIKFEDVPGDECEPPEQGRATTRSDA